MPRPPSQSPQFSSVSDVGKRLAAAGYLPDAQIATTVFLADRLGKPLLVEGPAGTGKTELAKALAAATGSELIRLQCYEGLDEARALYEWNYKKQLLRIQAADGDSWDELHDDVFAEEFLLSRPPRARSSSGCSATRGSTRPGPSTSGTTRSSCCGSRRPRAATRGRPGTTCTTTSSPRSSCSPGRC